MTISIWDQAYLYVDVNKYLIIMVIFGTLIISSMFNWKAMLVNPDRHNQNTSLLKTIGRLMSYIPVVRDIVHKETEESKEMNKKLSIMTKSIKWSDIQAIRYGTILLIALYMSTASILGQGSIILALSASAYAIAALMLPTRIVNSVYKWYIQMMIAEIPVFLDTLMIALKAQSSVYNALKATTDTVRFMKPYVTFVVNGWGRSNENIIQEAAARLDIDEFYSLSYMLQRALAYDRNKALTFFEKHSFYIQKFMEIDAKIEMNKKSVTYVFAVIVPALPSILFLIVPLVVRAVESLSSQY